MASERQIAANRANSKRSTGPKSAEGRAKASRNSYRHGLSSPIGADGEAIDEYEPAAALLRDSQITFEEDNLRQWALAEQDLKRIRKTRNALLAEITLSNIPLILRRLAPLDRYERLAVTRRRRAWRRFVPSNGETPESSASDLA